MAPSSEHVCVLNSSLLVVTWKKYIRVSPDFPSRRGATAPWKVSCVKDNNEQSAHIWERGCWRRKETAKRIINKREEATRLLFHSQDVTNLCDKCKYVDIQYAASRLLKADIMLLACL